MTIAIIDYGSGNLRSVANAFERVTIKEELNRAVEVTADPDRVARADHIMLPGVGAFGDCARGLRALPGMIDALEEAVLGKGRPFLGVCVGMQLMATRGLEHGEHAGLGWLDGDVVHIEPSDPVLKVPHMGWNTLDMHRDHPVLDGIATGDHAYFVHSYHLAATDEADVLATTDHGQTLTAIVGRTNMIGTQFHPEKSQATGLRLIANFLRWRP